MKALMLALSVLVTLAVSVGPANRPAVMSRRTKMRVDRVALSAAELRLGFALDEDGHGHRLHWKRMPVRYLLVSSNVPGGEQGEAAVHRAFATWSRASGNVRFEFGGFVDSGAAKHDGKNIVYWVREDWPFDANEAAVTLRAFDTATGELLEADIVLNGAALAWAANGSGYDIESSVTHEIGHLLGLGHSGDPDSTMYAKTLPGDVKKRSLSNGDLAALEAVYGVRPAARVSALSW